MGSRGSKKKQQEKQSQQEEPKPIEPKPKAKTPSVDESTDDEHDSDEDRHERRNDINDEDDDDQLLFPVDNQHNDPLKRGQPASSVVPQINNGHKMGNNAPKLESPVDGKIIIKMDDYDDEAVRDKIISEKRHYPGSYDYRPYLTIEETDEKDNRKKIDYYTQQFVTRKASGILLSHTPYPDYNDLRRREQRLNKPYERSLFGD
ncbi:unnamed protein product [Rotaria sp. Silwood1]|nr:unnamed protein product [Rotaria sp. Silwood1]CAF3367981.1 unnamed protein product [Rotaria sp. Silwood1]CAF3398809.1 unnamed protein product [Rotaria sp. Silwood1]CAF3402416.1 unnamed protein product [Rotaria sp. Silwood1]CAF4721027.1 unnamed protein product [Rotaria sp. Silwood1]